MATATYPANRQAAKASASIMADGTAVVRSGTQDLGTGTYTVMTQVAAQELGMPVSKVIFELGDTGFPEAPVSGGSQTVASVCPAVYAAARAVHDRLIAMAVGDASSPLRGLRADAIAADNGWLMERNRPERRELMAAVINSKKWWAGGNGREQRSPGRREEKVLDAFFRCGVCRGACRGPRHDSRAQGGGCLRRGKADQ